MSSFLSCLSNNGIKRVTLVHSGQNPGEDTIPAVTKDREPPKSSWDWIAGVPVPGSHRDTIKRSPEQELVPFIST